MKIFVKIKPRNVCVRKREGWKKEPGKAFKK
jgi:hypothetical protein